MLPADSPFYLTESIATYVQQRFWWIIANTPDAVPVLSLATPSPFFTPVNPGPTPSLHLPVQLVNEAELLAGQAAKAFLNRRKIV